MIRVHDGDVAIVGSYVDELTRHTKLRRSDLTVVVKSQPATPLPELTPTAPIPWGTLLNEKLTKRLLERLPVGAFVMSTVFGMDGRTVFAERIGEDRLSLWKRAVTVGASGRACRVFWFQDDFESARETLRI